MSPSKKMSRTAILAITALALPAFGLSASSVAIAVTACPTGWTQDNNNAAIDGIFCDRLAVTNGSFTVPTGIDEINVVAVAGGGGGGGGGQTTILVAGGGGGAGEIVQDFIDVVAGDVINYTAGDGGTGGANVSGGTATSGGNGGDSTVSIGTNAAILTAQGGRGGVNGEDGGAGGAAGGTGAYAGGAGSSANPTAGGGGGGLFSAGVAGVQGAAEKAGNGGTGYEYYSYPNIGHPTHSAYPEYETMMWNTNGNPDVYFLDRMGYGGGGGVVVDEGTDCSGDADAQFGYSIPEEGPIDQLGSGSCAIQGTPGYSGAYAVTAVHAGTGGGGGAGTATDSYSQPTAGYEGFVYFRIYVADEAGAGGGGDENSGSDGESENLAQTGAAELFGSFAGLAGGLVLLVGLYIRFRNRKVLP
jgi:hypothetical protein